ncbi:class I SAM-dependent methyltransferase [Metasolibacillus meyeri]|uniref:Class I SAM-dependent methyltransferase n=1 Tax=Metasolibacillus meyeri TaxID=1071052 RepID=A0AAW9NVS7_9BACL|nr:class I SAM-dependent methyltransferase [Metasolibacillus meyeri]MEC1178388.1 class I SAM-dependent methyltransferase [Metasolibacillus meyeri]
MKQNIYDNNDFFEQYKALRAQENNYNNLLEKPNFFKLVPNVKDKIILDIGCGMGDFAATCIKRGAKHVTGIDISANMIAMARSLHANENLSFEQVAFEDVAVPAASMDFISSSLAFHYIAEFSPLIEKISLTLCSGGILLFSIQHPIVTASKNQKGWCLDEGKNLVHYAVDDYQSEGLRKLHWFVEGVEMYHHTFSTIVNTLIEHGLQIEKIIEPKPTEEAISQLPKIQKELRRPSFLIVRARKM